jgi:hypothetical protein
MSLFTLRDQVVVYVTETASTPGPSGAEQAKRLVSTPVRNAWPGRCG